jgi:hypothetical protein
VLEDFWFKPYIGKFSGKKFAEEYAQKQLASQFVALDKRIFLYQPPNQRIRKTREEKLKVKRIIVLE